MSASASNAVSVPNHARKLSNWAWSPAWAKVWGATLLSVFLGWSMLGWGSWIDATAWLTLSSAWVVWLAGAASSWKWLAASLWTLGCALVGWFGSLEMAWWMPGTLAAPAWIAAWTWNRHRWTGSTWTLLLAWVALLSCIRANSGTSWMWASLDGTPSTGACSVLAGAATLPSPRPLAATDVRENTPRRPNQVGGGRW